MESISLYSEARSEYMKQLSTMIIPHLVDFFRTEYTKIAAQDKKQAMRLFQEFCAVVPRWNQDVIDTHVSDLLDKCACDYIEELMTAVFIAHTKMLTSIRVNSKQKKLQIVLPKLDRFLHRVFVECARAFWKAPFLFLDDLAPIERQKNVLQAESMCTDALSGAVRSLLPVKDILRDYLDEGGSESDEEAATHHSKHGRSKRKAGADVESSSDEDSSDEDVPEPAATAAEPVPVEPVAAPAPAAIAPVPMPVEPVSVPAEPAAPALAPETPTVSEPAPPVALPAAASATSFIVEKTDAPPALSIPPESSHSVDATSEKPEIVHLEKSTIEAEHAAPSLMIDTEPAVHFTPYDTVYDERTSSVSEIRYAPKISVEDKPESNWGMEDDVPKIAIMDGGSSIAADDIIDLEPVSARPVTPDIDAPLVSNSLDFEELS